VIKISRKKGNCETQTKFDFDFDATRIHSFIHSTFNQQIFISTFQKMTSIANATTCEEYCTVVLQDLKECVEMLESDDSDSSSLYVKEVLQAHLDNERHIINVIKNENQKHKEEIQIFQRKLKKTKKFRNTQIRNINIKRIKCPLKRYNYRRHQMCKQI
jgi:hypothetical protein